MKRMLFALTLLLAGCSSRMVQAPPPVPPGPPVEADHVIIFKWNQSFANNQACSSTSTPPVTISCISGFNEGYMSGTSEIQLHTDTAAVCTGTTQPENCTSTFNGILPIGNVVFYVATTYVDQNGAAGVVTTPAVSPGQQVAADSSTNLTVTIP